VQLLIRLPLQINNLRLCNNLINVVNNQSFPPMEQFPRSETGACLFSVTFSHSLVVLVAYNYYLGRLMIFEEQYQKVDSALCLAPQLPVDRLRNVLILPF